MFGILYKITVTIALVCMVQGYMYAQNQKKNTKLLPKLLKKDKMYDSIAGKNDAFGIQIIYTQINRGKNGVNFVDYYFNIDNNRYFYPSNTVFLPVAALTLEKITELSKDYDLDKHRYVRIDDAVTQEIIAYQDTSLTDNYASFAHFIKKMFNAGDKMSFNFCYDFLNQRYLNERMHSLGYRNSWFLHKLDNKAPENSRQSNTVTFFRTDVRSYYIDIIYLKRHPTTIPFYSIYVKKGEYNTDDYYSGRAKVLLPGKKLVKNGNIVDSTANFTYGNEFPIEDMHRFMKSLVFPELHGNRLSLSDDDYAFLFKLMGENNSFNYIMNDKLYDSSIKIFNNSGKDAGFLIDNAYVIDTKNGVDFFLSIVIKCNSADIQGEEYFEYEKTGMSFMKKISNIIHEHAINHKKNTGNFTEFLKRTE
ncbi:MAG: serine hydrolase [Prevotellaceae bacterium]|nr:serine hydrolase [Prevotellaceae bacterium]